MANPQAFQCKVRGCEAAKSVRLFKSGALVAHYRKAHNNVALGQGELQKQRKKLAQMKTDLQSQLEGGFVGAHNGPELALDHAADELNPPILEGLEVQEIMGQIGDVTIIDGTGDFLAERIKTLKAEVAIIQKQLTEVNAQMALVATELTRTLAAKAAWDAAEAANPDPKDSIGE